MAGPFRCNGETVQLSRQPDSELADVDHLLYFAQPLRADLPCFDGDELAEVVSMFTQQFAEATDKARREPGLGCRATS